MEWVQIGENEFRNSKTGQIHVCTEEDCDEIVSFDTVEYCALTGRAYSSHRSMNRLEESSVVLKVNTHVKTQKDQSVINEEIERHLTAYFDNVIFNIEGMDLRKVFTERIKERNIRDPEDIKLLFKYWKFTDEERDFWVKHAMVLHQVYGKGFNKVEMFLLSILAWAAVPTGLSINNVVHIAPNKKVMLRFPLPSEILKLPKLDCSMVTDGKKYIQMVDWSIYPFAQIKL
jgi:hypothetical protein